MAQGARRAQVSATGDGGQHADPRSRAGHGPRSRGVLRWIGRSSCAAHRGSAQGHRSFSSRGQEEGQG